RWALTRSADVSAILRAPRLSADRITPFFDGLSEEQRAETKDLGDSLRKWSVFCDPPQHTRLRSLFNKAFTSRAIERLRAGIEQVVHDLLAPAAARGRIDLIAEFAYPLPAVVICEMIGLAREDIDRIKVWSAAIESF